MGLKNGEKKSIVLYYSYRKTEFKYLSGEQLKNIIMCLLELDEKGTIEEEKDRLKAIREDNLTSAMYDIMKDKTERASEEWKRLNENRKKYKAENGCNTENEYSPSETIKNDLMGISDSERGIEIIIDRVKETDEEHKTIMTEKGRVINYDPENEDFCELGYYVIEKTKLKLMVDNNELISFQELK